MNITPNVGAIIVLYEPNWDLTEKVIYSILPQVERLYVIDNSPRSNDEKVLNHPKIVYKFLSGNKGIAYAQNIGLELLRKDNLAFSFFLDQDSIVEAGMVNILLNHYKELIGKGFCVGAIGPRPVNRQFGKEYRGSIKKGTTVDITTTEVTEIISSASLIPIENIIRTGNMDDVLFIDGVDHEWCWRCTDIMNGRFFISERTHLSHQLGEGDRKFLWRKVAIPTPFRTYYQYRNYFLLCSRKYVPFYWKLSNGIKYVIKFFYYPLFIAPRKLYFLNIIRGICEGIKTVIK